MFNLEAYKQRLAKARMYSELFNDERFQVWLNEVVKKRLDTYKEDSLSSEPDTKEHTRATMRYQELKYVTDGVFKVWKGMEDQLRKEIKRNLDEAA